MFYEASWLAQRQTVFCLHPSSASCHGTKRLMFEWGVFLLGRLHICSCLLLQPWRDSLRSPPKSIKFMRGVSCSHREIEIEVRRGKTLPLTSRLNVRARIIFAGTVKVHSAMPFFCLFLISELQYHIHSFIDVSPSLRPTPDFPK